MKRAATCAETGPLLHAHADGELSAAERSAVEAHVADCANCTREATRVAGNLGYLAEVMGRQRLAADFDTAFLLALPRKSAREVAAASARVAPRSVVIGGQKRRSRGGPLVIVAAILVTAGLGGWIALRPKPAARPDGDRVTVPEPGPRPTRMAGPADPRPSGPAPTSPGPAPTTAGNTPAAPGVVRSAAELVAAVRAHRGGGYLPVVGRGWSLLLEQPKEAAAVAAAARDEKSATVRAALVLCLGYDGSDEARELLGGFGADPAGEVRGAVALGLARSLSFGSTQKRPVPSGDPLGMAVEIGPIDEGPGLAALTGLLASETDEGARRAVVQAIGPSASASADVRARLVEGVAGQYGDALRENCLRALRGVQDAAIVEGLAEALRQPHLPAALRGPLVDAMLEADRAAAARSLAAVASSTDDATVRRTLVEAVGKAGGSDAESALHGFAQSDAEAGVRAAAVGALARYPSEATLALLDRVAESDSDQQVRVSAETAAKQVRPAVERARESAGGAGQE